jgi:3-phosphoshikimate 1-carboxyvinyltransferase
MKRSVAHREAGGRARAPASKSSMQRAVACALLASSRDGDGAAGASAIRSPSRSADCLAALGVAEGLGAEIEDRGDYFSMRGIGARGMRAGEGGMLSLSCGESGLCMRMFSPIAALFEGQVELAAEGSLRRRPVGMIADPLRELGASCDTASGLPPVLVKGPMRGGRAKVDGRESSQLLTGLLVALPLAARDSELEVEGLASRGYVDLTIDTMRAFGVRVERDLAYRRFAIPGRQAYRPADFTVEGDWSGAAFLLVAGAIAAKGRPVEVEGLDARSRQPDRAILGALRDAGADVATARAEGSDGSVSVSKRALSAFSFDATDCPDLFPPLACLALACEGESRIKGALRLRGKESDRAAALSEELGRLGARISIEGDEMVLRGGPLHPGTVGSRGDHRIAMAAAVCSLLAGGPVAIEDSECVAKSWPSFYEDLEKVAR